LIARAFQRYWRLVRGLSLFVEAYVIDDTGRILMVRQENGTSWECPRGMVRKNENVETALRRILMDIAGVEVNGKPELSFFSAEGRSGQTGLFIVRHWRPAPGNAREVDFFPSHALPAGASHERAERIRRCLRDRTASEV
jgi:ADP-ribose pyrophosphatase YjhB (NUDIX family)